MRDHLPLDHIVLAAPDLRDAVWWFREQTGVQAARGGQHLGWGTANALVGLGDGAYLEIVGPDRTQPEPEQPRPFGVDDVTGPTVVTWALRTTDIDATVAASRRAGHDPGDPAPMSRDAPDGTTLRWRLTPPGDRHSGLVPFLVDWGDTPHPTRRRLPEARLLDVYGQHPAPATVTPALAALGARLRVEAGLAVLLGVTVEGPDGPVPLY